MMEPMQTAGETKKGRYGIPLPMSTIALLSRLRCRLQMSSMPVILNAGVSLASREVRRADYTSASIRVFRLP